ncbi:MAG TPA: hypothetical protein ENK18_28250 [Deltaproteobacteria bacterium]|nr:hypothetical protein [Deltaproteobacteria bacterium]
MLLLISLSACSNSGLGRDPTGDTAVPELSFCPWVGTWELGSFECAGFVYDDWYLDYESARLKIKDDGESGCDVELVLIGADCRETEAIRWLVPEELLGLPETTDSTSTTALAEVEVEVEYDGISKCNPDECVFGDNDQAVCLVGDRAGGNDIWTIQLADGVLSVTDSDLNGGHIRDTAPGCPLDVVMSFDLDG